ncbi:glycerol-3-phosphate acyltransferase 1, mitochondrial-like isoform X2 [Stegostoma tigrinum]|uniref:glycerol-3-phosphate acyltransferase 1, mitochondrial-like isoform X2 n=1 Tax=Stegostoma tigrinum TaxID=3053191 RepID=UPI00286FF8F6|nr:glycerol-3-phosphate acyltransferase 1, mitochondrial-like isoform X2 [Stegostoma tigrinum]
MASVRNSDDGFVQVSASRESSEFVNQVKHSDLLSTLAFTSPFGGVSLFLGNTRPFVGRCCYICAPQSWALLFHNHLALLGFRNAILVTETQTRYRGWLARRLCYFLFVVGRTVYPDVPFLEHRVINNARVQQVTMENLCNICDQKSHYNMRNVLGIFYQIQAIISPLLLRLTSWVLLKIFNWVFVNLQVHRGQIEMLRKAREKYAGPFVFLPLHKSRLDYLLVTFVLFCHSIRAPYFTCGEDVQLPLLRPLLRKLGGIFIPRDSGDHLFRVVLNSYIEELLNEQQSLAVYLKDPVSYSVRSSLTGFMWLAWVFDAFQNRLIPDAVLIPVGVSYDRIVDEHYLEQMGTGKTSVFGAIRWVLRFLQKRYGCIRVDFGQPVSLKDYIENEGIHLCTSAIPLQKILLPYVLGYSTDSVYCEKSQDWLLNNDELPQLSKHHQALVADLGRHMLYTCALNSILREVAKNMVDWDSNAEVAISQEELICKTVQLCHLLTTETLLLPPCRSVYQFSQEAVDKLMYCEILIMEENENKQPACDTWQKQFGKELTWKVMDDFDDSESDADETVWKCYFKLGQTQESHTFYLFLCSLLQPVLKAYEAAAGLLHKLDFPIEESQCVLRMFQLLHAQVEEQHESATFSIANSAIKTFRELGVFKEEPGTKGPLLKLSETFQEPDNLLKLQWYIQQFCD